MACKEQKELSSFIKLLHTNLRNKANVHGADTAWESHIQQKHLLEKYAKCMEKLAVKYWEPNSDDKEKSAFSRIKWCVEQCTQYFMNRLHYHRQREYDISNKIENSEKPNVILNTFSNKLRLLDVGSCYNPFKEYDIFNVTAIDLCPANTDVQQCDFLKVSCGNSIITSNNLLEINQLPIDTFDIIIFSLLLEYLPSSDQRLLCCKKAYTLLKSEGILIIITPDSKHVGANAKLIKSWRYTLGNLGFMRIKYEKLAHVHCLVFRKCLFPNVAQRWVTMHQSDGFNVNVLNIPQDFKISEDKSNEQNKDTWDSTLCSELTDLLE